MLRDPERILILSYRHVGDVLFTTPALRALRRRFPQARISVIAGRAAAAVLEGNPHVDELLLLPRAAFLEKWKLLPALRRRRFDAGILFQHTLSNALLLPAIGCRVCAGLAWKGCGPLLTHRAPYVADRHEVDRYLAIVQTLGAQPDDRGLEMTVGEAERRWAQAFFTQHRLGESQPVVAIFPGSSAEWAIKRWAPTRFARVADALARKESAAVLLLGGPADEEAVRTVSEALQAPHVNAVGQTNLKQLAALLERCALLISNDTGPMHLATAVGTPVVDLVGPGDPRKTGPYGKGHVVVQKVPPGSTKAWQRRPDRQVPMDLIGVEEVEAIARQQLRRFLHRAAGSAPVRLATSHPGEP